MVGCTLLLQISKALSKAKSDPRPFGGINIIFAGDFAQLPPVLMTKLYAKLSTSGRQSSRADDNINGKLLWLTVDTVVMLHEIRRQSSEDGSGFIDLLQRLRRGRYWTDPAMRTAPVIVTQNELKDKLNIKAAIAFASRTGQPLHWYLSTD
ncbi:hypothetical protein GGF50DRAFT_40376, partial [Schizophyllum commune]